MQAEDFTSISSPTAPLVLQRQRQSVTNFRLSAGAPVTHEMLNRQTKGLGGSTMKIRRYARSFSTFLGNLFTAVFKAAITSMLLGILVVSVMHYMGVPVPSAGDLLRGVSRLANVLS